jgi:hypothetical protein
VNAAQKRSLRNACLAGLLAAAVLVLFERPRAALFVLLADLGGLIFLPRTLAAPRASPPPPPPPRAPLPTGLVCRTCGKPAQQRVARIERRGVPHGDTGHDTSFRTLDLYRCDECGRGELHRDDHDCWSHDEEWDMSWTYGLAASEMGKLEQAISSCPALNDPACTCPLHAGLRASHPRPGPRGELISVVVRFDDGVPVVESRE